MIDLILPAAAVLGIALMLTYYVWGHPRRRSKWDGVTDSRNR